MTMTKVTMMIIVNDNRGELRCSVTFNDEDDDNGGADGYDHDNVDVYLVAA